MRGASLPRAMSAVPALPARVAAQRRSRQEWALLGAALLVLLVFTVWNRNDAYRAVDAQERERLEIQARAADQNLSLIHI